MLYTSITSDKIKGIKKLQLKKYRDETNLFIVSGDHLVKEAYKNGFLKELILKEGTKFELDIPTIYVNDSVLKYISELDTPSNVMGICFKKDNQVPANKRVLILDGIQDPGNVGTIIRSAVAFDIDTIYYERCADFYSSKVIRASQGLIFGIDLIETDLISKIKELREQGIYIYGTKVDDGHELKDINKKDNYALVVGNEGNGVREEILSLCNEHINIKTSNKCESLNVGVATSIILYELR